MNNHIFANRIASLLIVSCLLLSSCAGVLLFWTSSGSEALLPWESGGDRTVGSDYTRVRWDITNYNMIGNLTIRNNGTVAVTNGSLMFSQNLGNDGLPGTSDDHIFTIVVEDGGRLILNNAVLTTNLNQINAYPSLAIIVRNGGFFEANNSVLKFPGYLVVDNSTFVLRNSTVTGFTYQEIRQYCNPSYFPTSNQTSAFACSPVMLFMSSVVNLCDSRIEKVFEPPDPITVDVTHTYSHSYPFVSGTVGGVSTDFNLSRMPKTLGPTNTALQSLSTMTMDDLKMFRVRAGERMATSGMDVGGLVFNASDGVKLQLNIKYNTSTNFVQNNYVYYSFNNGPLVQTTISPDLTPAPYDPSYDNQVTATANLPAMSSADLSGLNISFLNAGPGSVFINKVWVSLIIPEAAYKNITVAGSSQFTAVNSFIDVDFSNDALVHNAFVVRDDSDAYFYGVYVNMTETADPTSARLPAFVAVDKKFDATPVALGSSDTTGGHVSALLEDDGSNLDVLNTRVMSINGFNVSGLNSDIAKARLYVNYHTLPGFTANNHIQWQISGESLSNTNITPSVAIAPPDRTEYFDFPTDIVNSLAALETMTVQYTNNGGTGISFDKVWIEVTLRPTIYIYRWSNSTVLDSQNLPVAGARVDATLQNSPGTAAYYYSPSGLSSAPPQQILDYLGKTALNFNLTGPNGVALIPLLSEVQDQYNPNPGQSLAYDLLATYTGATPVRSSVSFVTYPSMHEEYQTVSQTLVLSSLALDKPDLYVSSLSVTPSNLYENGTITVETNISNEGATAATNVLVTITGYVGGTEAQWQANYVISTVGAGLSVPLTARWTSVPAGIHTITVKIDPSEVLVEVSKLNNERSVQVTVLPNIPDLSVPASAISFDTQPAYTGSPVTANVTIRNLAGRDNAVNAVVEFFAGNPSSGGQFLGSTSVNVPAGGSNQANLTWYPTQIGTYPVYVCVNRDKAIPEYNYADNVAYKEIVVRLATDGKDLVIEGTPTHPNMTFINDVIPYDGNIVVRENGTLTLNGASLWVLQRSQNELQIVVDNNGTLILNDHSDIYSTYDMRLYLFGDARLFVNNSKVSFTMGILADERSIIRIEGSTIQPDLVTPSTSTAVLYASNTTFQSAWSSFGGHAIAYLTNISIPSLSPKDSAQVFHYRWMNVVVLDGTGARLPNAYVNLEYLTAGPYAHQMTDSQGTAMFRALCDEITPSGAHFVGVYRLNVTFWFGSARYDSAVMNPSLDPYSSPLVQSTKRVTVSIPSALPDLDPPIYLSNYNPGRSQVVNLSTQVNNTGVVPARNVLVRFTDNGNIINDIIVPIVNAGNHAIVWTNWTVGYPLGMHNVSVIVDPYGAIPEINKSNNMAWRMVMVSGVADLVVNSDGVTLTPSSPTIGDQTHIVALINNTGDAAAANVNVTFYATITGGSPMLINYHVINYLDFNSSASPSVTWQPSVKGVYTITVKIDEKGLITETSKSNNQASVSATVKNYADLVASDLVLQPAGTANIGQNVSLQATVYNNGESDTSNVNVRFYLGDPNLGNLIYNTSIAGTIASKGTYIVYGSWTAVLDSGVMSSSETIWVVINPDRIVTEISYANNEFSQTLQIVENRPDLSFKGDVSISSGANPITNAGVGERVDITVYLTNNGLTNAPSSVVVFYAVDKDQVPHYVGRDVVDVLASSTVRANISWAINVTMGEYNISIQANPDHLIGERDYSNNEILRNFTVTAPNPTVTINLGGKANFNAGEMIVVQGYVTNTLTGDPIVNATVTVSLFNANEAMMGTASTTRTSESGYYLTELYIQPGASGPLSVKVTVNVGDNVGSQSAAIQVGQIIDTNIPWYIYVFILALVMVIIIGFSAYLYRYGLGKMVECGECGALIPESSKKCPKCGTEFEVGTAKCSECGAWIPASSAICPECGAKFLSEAINEPEDAYIKKMRDQYEAFISSYRDEAKIALGKKFSDAKFADWWKKQPAYVSFEDWLSQEELKRKSGAFPCSICGTPNPRGSTVCHKCGTVFETAPKEDKKEGEEEKPRLRRIIKKPVQKPAQKPVEPPTEKADPEEKQSP